ncbi:MAG: orotidine 5'-phosphate decarboxylase, partial [Planctomycetota bacterium]|nr:orotidine 5'-phosphate decarboxylase [Planctomycetota bacterium]
LVRTSNPSGADIQELEVAGEPLYLKVARLVEKWGEGSRGERGLNPVGVVVGATAPEQAAAVRKELPEAFFLVPGYGAQGGGAQELAPFFIEGGRGVVVNSSRSVLYAFDGKEGDWREAVGEAASSAREDLETVRTQSG